MLLDRIANSSLLSKIPVLVRGAAAAQNIVIGHEGRQGDERACERSQCRSRARRFWRPAWRLSPAAFLLQQDERNR
jgi:hypothetical protein